MYHTSGQLIYKGYQQETGLGRVLRESYLQGDRKLFPSLKWSDSVASMVYFRGDDQQRTLESGQLAIRSMFDIPEDFIIDWHTGGKNLRI